MFKEFNLKFSLKLQWPFTFKKNDEKDQSHVPRVSEIQVSSTHHGVTTTEQIKIDSDGVRFTKKSGYTKPDKRYSGHWENKEATGSGGSPPVVRKIVEGYQRSTNYYKTVELKHEGLSEEQIAQQLNISQEKVSQLWSDYTKSSATHKTIYSKKAFQSVKQNKNYTHYDKEFITAAVTQALNTSRAEVRKLYNLPESTLRQWIQRYKQ